MKTKLLLHKLSLAGLVAFALPASAQIYSFDTNDGSGVVNVSGVEASGLVDFSYSELNSVADIQVVLNNDTTGYDSAYITGFYILRPWTKDSETRLDASLVDVIPSGWSDDDNNFNSVWGGLNTGLANNDEYFFFGGEAGNPDKDGIGIGSGLTFLFNMQELPNGETIDWEDYAAADKPHIFLRWQGMTGGSATSAKGYDSFDEYPDPGTSTVVPEPSAVAAMAVLGLGGILLMRRRLTRKS